MMWLYILPGTWGLMLLIPAVARAWGSADVPVRTRWRSAATAGAFLVGFGLVGLVANRFDAPALITVLLALASGLAGALLHGELLLAVSATPRPAVGSPPPPPTYGSASVSS